MNENDISSESSVNENGRHSKRSSNDISNTHTHTEIYDHTQPEGHVVTKLHRYMIARIVDGHNTLDVFLALGRRVNT